MFPSDVQLVIDPLLGIDVPDGVGEDLGGGGGVPNTTFRVNRAIVICSPMKRPGAFVARFPGSGAPLPTAPLDVTTSGRISETVKSGANTHYEDEAVIVYAVAGGNKLMLPVELDSALDDVFRMDVQSGLQPAPGADTHRLSSIEPLIRRGPSTFPGDRLLNLSPVTSNVLDTQGGTLGTLKDIPDVNLATPPRTPVGFDARGRFFGYRIQGSNIHALLRLLGTFLRGHKL